MKKISLFLLTFFMLGSMLAQAPQSFKYQAVARNSEGAVLANAAIGLKVDIRQGSINGNAVYSETFTTASNSVGIFNVNIGEGMPVTGSFSDIDWGDGSYFLHIALDVNGGTNYTDMGTTRLLSVPYSLYTGSIYVNYSNDTLYIGDQYVIISGGGGGGGGGNTVTDFDGNTYETVTIGNQTWLKQNLRSLHYSDGTPIENVWAYGDDESNVAIWGRLYSWDAAMHGASSSNGNPSGVQGACPDGWHMPSKAEFEQLENFLDGEVGQAGCALKSTNTAYWETPNNNNNSSGFSARGSGIRSDPGNTYDHLKEEARYWSSTEDVNNSNVVHHMGLKYQYCTIYINSLLGTKNHGYSIRCVKD